MKNYWRGIHRWWQEKPQKQKDAGATLWLWIKSIAVFWGATTIASTMLGFATDPEGKPFRGDPGLLLGLLAAFFYYVTRSNNRQFLHLQKGETIIYEATDARWLMYGRAIVLLLIAGYLCKASVDNKLLLSSVPQGTAVPLSDQKLIIQGLAGLCAWMGLWYFVKAGATRFIVTNRRVARKAGVISRDVQEIRLDHVDAVRVRETILGRFIGYGSIVITSIGGVELKATLLNPRDLHESLTASEPNVEQYSTVRLSGM